MNQTPETTFIKQEEEEEEVARQIIYKLIEVNENCHKKPEDVISIRKAFEFAASAHRGMRRKSGELYIFHPVSVAKIAVEEIGLGATSAIACLLHDVVEDTNISLETISAEFGPTVANIVNGLTKLNNVVGLNTSLQIENFRKLLLSMVEDMRVILIKIADRLHNSRTLDFMQENKRYKIAAETLTIFAPIAHRLGLFEIKTELEDLAMKHEYPQEYNSIKSRLDENEANYQNIINSVAEPIKRELDAKGYKYTIKSRTKSIYSIWKKMVNKKVSFEEIYDILAMRIIFTPTNEEMEKSQCWDVYTSVTSQFKSNTDRLRDWISAPKQNGYEALHTTIMSPSGKWVEVQIRSERMDEIAERGFAAHWKYKEDGKSNEYDNWINGIRQLLESHDLRTHEMLDMFKRNLDVSEMTIFTIDGETRIMPTGATALDFAYAMHTDLGNRCIGAKINSRLKGITFELKNGDQVEIIVSPKQQVKREWLDIVVTAKAKDRIRSALRKSRRPNIEAGEKMLTEELKKMKLSITSRIMNKLRSHYNLNSNDEVFFAIGIGDINLNGLDKILKMTFSERTGTIWNIMFQRKTPQESEVVNTDPKLLHSIPKNKQVDISDDYFSRKYTVATCCAPIPGDDIIGFVDEKKDQLVIHSRSCPIAMDLMASHGDKIVSATWTSTKTKTSLCCLLIDGFDRKGVISDISKTISMEHDLDIRSLNFNSHDGIFSGKIFLFVPETTVLNGLIEKIKKINSITKVVRDTSIDNTEKKYYYLD